MQPFDRGPMKAGGTQECFLEEEKPEFSSIIPPFVHFFIHTFSTYLLRAKRSVALCFQINYHHDLSHRDGCYYLFP